MVRRLALGLLVLALPVLAVAGDIASFENLGFNSDGSVFAFGQYGIDSDASAPYAGIYIVDVTRNAFVSGGVFEEAFDVPLTTGQDGRGGLYKLISDATSLLDRYGINHLNRGRPIYILVDGQAPRAQLSFRDFNANRRFEVRLIQDSRGSGDEVSARFRIELVVTTSDDRTITRTIGRPDYYRAGIASYRITQILASPTDSAVVFVVEKRRADGSVTFMVETTTLN